MPNQPPKRLQIPFLGEFYYDELIIEARLKNRSEVLEASSLICAKLMQRTEQRNKMIKTLADKRGVSFEEMRRLILTGEYEPLSPEEIIKSEEDDEI